MSKMTRAYKLSIAPGAHVGNAPIEQPTKPSPASYGYYSISEWNMYKVLDDKQRPTPMYNTYHKMMLLNHISDYLHEQTDRELAVTFANIMQKSTLPIFFYRGEVFKKEANVRSTVCNTIPIEIKKEIDTYLNEKEKLSSDMVLIKAYLRDTLNSTLNGPPNINMFPECLHLWLSKQRAATLRVVSDSPSPDSFIIKEHFAKHQLAIAAIKAILMKRIIRGTN